jgi:hypothetical protein
MLLYMGSEELGELWISFACMWHMLGGVEEGRNWAGDHEEGVLHVAIKLTESIIEISSE